VVEAGSFSHPCEGEAVLKLTNEKVSIVSSSKVGLVAAAAVLAGVAAAQSIAAIG
jgi:hypothetical protein